MKWNVEPPSVNALRIIEPRYKLAGNVSLAIGMVIVFFRSFWEPMVFKYLVSVAISAETARYIVFCLSNIPFVLLAIGGFLLCKAREKPLRPTAKDVKHGKF